MNTFKTNSILLCVGLGFFFITLVTFNAFTHKRVYEKSLGLVTDVFHKDGDGNIISSHTPYDKITNSRLIRWDAFHYNVIASLGYGNQLSESERFFAFFPLFPFVWKYSGASPAGICIINYLLFIISIILLIDVFFKEHSLRSKIVIFSLSIVLPQTVIFNIPYAESLFIFSFSLAFWGLIKDKYWLYVFGMVLLGMTRPAINILSVAFICVEIFLYVTHRKFSHTISLLFRLLFPLLVGTLIAMSIQFYYSGNFFSFIIALKCWGKTGFCLPTGISDWSEYGYSISLFCIAFVVLFSSISFISQIKDSYVMIVRNRRYMMDEKLSGKKGLMYRFTLYSMLYFIGVFLFILFTQKGSLHGIQRYIAATPFFYVFIFSFYDSIVSIFKKKMQTAMIFILFLLGLVGLKLWSAAFTFNDLGFFLFFICFLFLCFKDTWNRIVTYIVFVVIILLCIVWKTYLFQAFIAEAWIFT